MYRIQLAGNDYATDREIGVHYQIHRGIGVHHAEALATGLPLRVNVFIGGPPSMAVAAVMPLPEGMPKLSFAGLLGGHRIEMADIPGGLPVLAEADFCITGTIQPGKTKPEGPFGDHIGYYSLVHDFPVMNVESVYYRYGAIWPYTAVGRPPQEDTTFGAFIHELTGQLIPDVLPGVHAVDEAGVHPLLLAIGSERYVPYASKREPQELLTIANAILGQGQLSLAKYLLIVAHEDNPNLDIHNPEEFICHLLERVDWRRDMHFQTATTIDTLDYSGDALNKGSKVVIAAAGEKGRELACVLPGDFQLPEGFSDARVCMPGVLTVQGPGFVPTELDVSPAISALADFFELKAFPSGFPLVVVVDDAEFTARTIANFLWVTFTRSNPAADIHGVGASVSHKHWGCTGPLIIDARLKPHHAPPLLDDPETVRRVEALAAPGGPLYGII
jgi:4-hydroxy-3-polyprenylbenzoate decarboxylase